MGKMSKMSEVDNRSKEEILEERVKRLEGVVDNLWSHIFMATRTKDGKTKLLLKGRVDALEKHASNNDLHFDKE